MKQDEFYDFLKKVIKGCIYFFVGLMIFNFLMLACLTFGGNL